MKRKVEIDAEGFERSLKEEYEKVTENFLKLIFAAYIADVIDKQYSVNTILF